MKTKLAILFFTLVCVVVSNAQTKTNLEIINGLIDNSITQVDSVIGGKQTIKLVVESSPTLEVLKTKVFESFNSRGYILKSEANASYKSIEITLIAAKVDYKDSYSDGLFGGTMIERTVSLNGSFMIKDNNDVISPVQFNKSYSDTVKLDDISSLENQALPFTKAKLPSLPLLSNLWEPIIVVGTLIVTVILLFTVRSK